MRAAAIDIGTNTIRLLIGEAAAGQGYRPVLGTQETTRLGQGLLPDRLLQPEPMRRSLAVLKRYREIAASYGVSAIAAVGTAALREARNQEEFIARARSEADLEVGVISGQEEARLTLLGVRAALSPSPQRMLMLDIGGGSTELLLADGDAVLATVSTGLGVVKLTEQMVASDPPTRAELERIERAAVERFRRARDSQIPDLASVDVLAGTAGTVTNLAAIDLALAPYDPSRVTGHRLSRERVAHWLQQLVSLPLDARRSVRGLEPARADVIVAGAVVCLAAMDILGFSALTVSDGGLREGILLDLLRRASGAGRAGGSPSDGRVKA